MNRKLERKFNFLEEKVDRIAQRIQSLERCEDKRSREKYEIEAWSRNNRYLTDRFQELLDLLEIEEVEVTASRRLRWKEEP